MPSPAAPPKALTVAQVVLQIKALIERQFPSAIWIEGQVQNCKYHDSGHIYFSLVDEHATDRFGQPIVLPCAFFRGANQHLKFKLVDGLKILCLGQITTYESRAQYQLKVLRAEPKGIGALQLAFEQLKKRLGAEGLFDEARKRPIPKYPRRIGLITSPSGSAVHDMVSKLRDSFELVIVPVKVQGDGAAEEIVEALDLANRLHLAQVLIVGRGGGSVEDLWAFNEEPVARAIARSRIPVISAVGHQDDWTIADYVADLRASTPTDAAKQLVAEQQAFAEQAAGLIEQLEQQLERYLDEQDHRVRGLAEQLRLLHPVHQLREYKRLATQWDQRLTHAMSRALDRAEQQLQGLCGRLQALSPLAVLSRGYSITFVLPDRHVVVDAAALKPGNELETRLSRGSLTSRVTSVRPVPG